MQPFVASTITNTKRFTIKKNTETNFHSLTLNTAHCQIVLFTAHFFGLLPTAHCLQPISKFREIEIWCWTNPPSLCPLSIAHPLFPAHCSLPAILCPLSTVNCSTVCPLFTAHCLPPIVRCFSVQCLLLTVYCPLFAARCPLFTVHCPILSVHCPLFTVR